MIITPKGMFPISLKQFFHDGSVFSRFGLLPLSMSNLRKSKSSSRVSSHQLVSVVFDIIDLCIDNSPHIFLFRCFFHFWLMISITFPAFLTLKTPGKFVCVYVSIAGAFEMWLF